MGGLTGGLEKSNSLIVICLAKNTGGLGKNDEIHVLLKIENSQISQFSCLSPNTFYALQLNRRGIKCMKHLFSLSKS